MFIWKDGIPHIGEKCDLFVDRTFDIHVKSELARFSIDFIYEAQKTFLKVKLIRGAEFINYFQIVLNYESEGVEGKMTLKVW